jgi:hypothetical protein
MTCSGHISRASSSICSSEFGTTQSVSAFDLALCCDVWCVCVRVCDVSRSESVGSQYSRVLTMLLRLRQACSHYSLCMSPNAQGVVDPAVAHAAKVSGVMTEPAPDSKPKPATTKPESKKKVVAEVQASNSSEKSGKKKESASKPEVAVEAPKKSKEQKPAGSGEVSKAGPKESKPLPSDAVLLKRIHEVSE